MSSSRSGMRNGAARPTKAAVVTVSATAGQGPGRAARATTGPATRAETRPPPSINWNPLTWVGLEKKPPTVLGPEPDRDWLTDPPKGYREPAEGVGRAPGQLSRALRTVERARMDWAIETTP